MSIEMNVKIVLESMAEGSTSISWRQTLDAVRQLKYWSRQLRKTYEAAVRADEEERKHLDEV